MDLHPQIEAILIARGFKTKLARRAFLNPNYDEHLHDPFLLKDMQKAVKRISSAIKAKEQIVIYGDYDIDGLTATTLLLDYFERAGIKAGSYIPDRFEEGYGVSVEAVKKLKKGGAKLIITVDCGSKSHEALEWAKKNKLDVIVTDHHEVSKKLPPAAAIVNPKRHDDNYPFKDLAGCGVAFKLVQALQSELELIPSGQEKWLLDLVAMGTVCDVVSLIGENRVLVSYGLQVLQKSPRLGLRALAATAQTKMANIDTYHLGFVIGPRLNAAGRLEHAQIGLDLLTTTSKREAINLATKLEKLNTERRAEQDKIYREASVLVEEFKEDPVLVLADASWSHGVVGIVASKLMERFRKPTLLLQILGKEAKGSARSFGDFNIVEALDSAEKLLIKHGGHFYAAGCTLATDNIAALRKQLNSYYQKQGLKNQEELLDPVAEATIERLDDLSIDFYEQLMQLRPFGMGNRRPVFRAKGLKVVELRQVGANQQHLKLTLCDEHEHHFDCIGFSLVHKNSNLKKGDTVDAWFELDLNVFNGRSALQLLIRGLKRNDS